MAQGHDCSLSAPTDRQDLSSAGRVAVTSVCTRGDAVTVHGLGITA